jgi:hypothetical protein
MGVLILALPAACAPPPQQPGAEARALPPLAPAPTLAPVASRPPRADPPCESDADCGYDPASDRCVADPRANRQPAIVDQGIACFCASSACAAMRVPPVPCESDASCAVDPEPRPHPVAADRAHPHERGRRCHDFVFSTTCERTNICTMHRLACPRR